VEASERSMPAGRAASEEAAVATSLDWPIGLDDPRFLGRSIDALETPCLLVNFDRLEANIRRWQDIADASSMRLRPHIKTHKVPEIARLQVDGGACGIAVAKVAEAEVFVQHGFDDVVIAYPIFGESKWARAAALARVAKIAVNVDNLAALRGLSEAATAQDVSVGIQVEIDTGFHRCGFPIEDFGAIEEAAQLAQSLPGLEFEGVTTHRGYFFAGANEMSIDEAGEREGALLVNVADQLRAAGLEVREVTAGGTITGRGVAQVEGVTEIRAGTYVFNDLMQLGFGSASPDDLALSVLATVVSAHRPPKATIDAGSKTFSSDRGVIGADAADGGPIARAVARDVSVERLTEEHGMVTSSDGALQVGERLAFFPMHACTSVNLADELYGVRNGVVEHVWPVSGRGKRT
jgi:D-serine deaminase-like pyridoxal phosphate-dependent protein